MKTAAFHSVSLTGWVNKHIIDEASNNITYSKAHKRFSKLLKRLDYKSFSHKRSNPSRRSLTLTIIDSFVFDALLWRIIIMTLQDNVMLQELEKHNITKINPCIEFICWRTNAIFKFHGGKLEDLTLWWNWTTIDILYWLVRWCVPVHAGLDFGGCNQAIQESNGLTPH